MTHRRRREKNTIRTVIKLPVNSFLLPTWLHGYGCVLKLDVNQLKAISNTYPKQLTHVFVSSVCFVCQYSGSSSWTSNQECLDQVWRQEVGLEVETAGVDGLWSFPPLSAFLGIINNVIICWRIPQTSESTLWNTLHLPTAPTRGHLEWWRGNPVHFTQN